MQQESADNKVPAPQSGCPTPPAEPALPPDAARHLRESFVVVEQQSDIAALIFYRHLFTLAPELRALFHTSIELQGRKLMESLRFTVNSLDNPRALVPMLEAMGRRHLTYGTKDEHYAVVVRAMMLMLAEVLGKNFTPETSAAWQNALEFISEAMQRGAREVAAYGHAPGG